MTDVRVEAAKRIREQARRITAGELGVQPPASVVSKGPPSRFKVVTTYRSTSGIRTWDLRFLTLGTAESRALEIMEVGLMVKDPLLWIIPLGQIMSVAVEKVES